MNAGARTRHRWITTALAVVVPVVFVAGLAARPGTVSNNALPEVRSPLDDYATLRAGFDAVPIAGGVVDVRIMQAPDRRRLAVEFAPRSAPTGADLLVYWTPQTGTVDALPELAILVGTLAGTQPRRFLLPELAGETRGQLVFYSLAHRALASGSVVVDPGAP